MTQKFFFKIEESGLYLTGNITTDNGDLFLETTSVFSNAFTAEARNEAETTIQTLLDTPGLIAPSQTCVLYEGNIA